MVQFSPFRLIWLVFLVLLFSKSFSHAQAVVRGTVVASADGSPLIGIPILIKGSSQGTLTEEDGSFVLPLAKEKEVISISAFGYLPQELSVEAWTVIQVSMVAAVSQESGAISNGYQHRSQSELTGAIVQFNREELPVMADHQLLSSLNGKVAGLQLASDYRPGGQGQVRLRGYSSFYDNEPLYVLDGIPVQGGLSMLNPTAIASVQVLKDAASTAMYGARGANGVVVLSSRQGEAGKARLSFQARYGIQQVSRQLSLLNSQEWGELQYEAQRNDYVVQHGSAAGFVFQHDQYGEAPGQSGFLPGYIFPSGAFAGDPGTNSSLYSREEPWHLITQANPTGTDWQSEIFDMAPSQDYQLSLSGGSPQSTYYLGLNYLNQRGIVKATGFDRIAVQANTSHRPRVWLQVGNHLNVSHSRNQTFEDHSVYNPISHAYQMHPLVPTHDIMGEYAGAKSRSLGFANNPLAQLERAEDNVTQSWRILGAAFAEISPIKALRFRTQLGVDYRNEYLSEYHVRPIEEAEPAQANTLDVRYQFQTNWIWTNSIQFEQRISGLHHLQLMAGTEAIENRFRSLGGGRSNFYTDDLSYRFLDAGESGISNQNRGTESALFSYFGTAHYGLLDRYLIDVSVRQDASSRFGAKHPKALFPSVGVAWRISQEPFLARLGLINEWKLRASWGQSGNLPMADYLAYSSFRSSLTQSSYDIAGTDRSVVRGFDSQQFGNPNLRWETTSELNLGMDFTLLNRLRLQVDWFSRKSSDLLYRLPLAGVQGEANAPFQAAGSMSNTGLEVALSYSGGWGQGFRYEIGGNLATYQNQVLTLGNDPERVLEGLAYQQQVYNQSMPGAPISAFYGLEIDGFIGEEEVQNGEYDAYYDRPGRFRYVDQDDNGIINDADRTIIGNPHPDWVYGLYGTLRFLQLDASLLVQGVQGNEVIQYARRWNDFGEFSGNYSQTRAQESWTPELGDQSSLPVLSAEDRISSQPSSYYVEDGSYLRVRQVQVGYTFSHLRQVSQFRVYLQANNLLTLSRYSGADPDISPSPTAQTQLGLDVGTYPAARSVMLGLDLDL